jgi:ribulose-phosphate 3-epimerase
MRIIPAILEKDFNELQKKVALVDGLAELIQIDIMDGQYVESKSVSLEELLNLKHLAKLEIHLMVNNPRDYFATCAELKAERVFWHSDAAGDEGLEVFEAAGKFGFLRGLALSPEVELEKIGGWLNSFDAVLVMSVAPGKQGQSFIPKSVSRVEYLKEHFPDLKIAVDGGVDVNNVKALIEAGAEDLCVGSALLNSANLSQKFAELKSFLN